MSEIQEYQETEALVLARAIHAALTNRDRDQGVTDGLFAIYSAEARKHAKVYAQGHDTGTNGPTRLSGAPDYAIIERLAFDSLPEPN